MKLTPQARKAWLRLGGDKKLLALAKQLAGGGKVYKYHIEAAKYQLDLHKTSHTYNKE